MACSPQTSLGINLFSVWGRGKDGSIHPWTPRRRPGSGPTISITTRPWSSCFPGRSNRKTWATAFKVESNSPVLVDLVSKWKSVERSYSICFFSVLGTHRIRMFLGLPDLDPYKSDVQIWLWTGSFPFLIKVLSGLKYFMQNKILTQNF
jgi:hypothetical protein